MSAILDALGLDPSKLWLYMIVLAGSVLFAEVVLFAAFRAYARSIFVGSGAALVCVGAGCVFYALGVDVQSVVNMAYVVLGSLALTGVLTLTFHKRGSHRMTIAQSWTIAMRDLRAATPDIRASITNPFVEDYQTCVLPPTT